MKRRLLAAMVLLALAAPALTAQQFYRSNAAGSVVSRIPESARGDYEYVLEVRREDGVRERRLYRDGDLLRRERASLDGRGRVTEEARYEQGVLREVRRFDERGRPVEELDYDTAGLLIERVEVAYEGDRRVAERHIDPEGELLYTDRFEYDSAGRIRRVRRMRDTGVVRSTSYAYADGRLFEESFRSGNRTTVVRYDAGGRVAQREQRVDGELTEEQTYRYEGEDTRIVTTRSVGENRVRVERFVEGRIVATTVEVDGDVVSTSRHEYSDGRLFRVITEGPGIAGRRVERYEYDTEGELARRVVQLEGRVTREVLYSGERTREEITYRDGEPFLRVTYRDDNPVSRELVAGE